MTSSNSKIYDGRLRFPCSMYVSGSSGSGKTVFVKKLIENRDSLFDEKIQRIVWCYGGGHFQDIFHDPALRDVEFIEGFQPEKFETTDSKGKPIPTLVIIDDLMSELVDSPELAKLFTKSRHTNVAPVFLTQNLFFKSSVFRTCSLNANYIVVMRMLRDKKQVMTLIHQMFPDNPRFAKEAIFDATKEAYSYAIIDTRQETPDELRIRTKIFPEDWADNGYYAQTVYVPQRGHY